MTIEDVRAFAARDWASIGEADSAHWVAEFSKHGPNATMAAARALWEHLRSIRPEWPTEEETAQDFADLLRFKQLLDRASHSLAGR